MSRGIYRHPPAPHIGGRQPLEPRKLPPSITAVPEDNPPFGLRNPLWPILLAWQPGAPRPWIPNYLVQGVEAAAADNPPFGIPNPIWQILQSWIPDAPQPQVGAHVPASVSAVPEDNPPFGLPPVWLRNVVDQWKLFAPGQFQLKGTQFIPPTPPAAAGGINPVRTVRPIEPLANVS